MAKVAATYLLLIGSGLLIAKYLRAAGKRQAAKIVLMSCCTAAVILARWVVVWQS